VTTATTTTSTGLFVGGCVGLTQFRARMSSYSSGTALVSICAVENPPAGSRSGGGSASHVVVDSGTLTAVTAITNALPSGTNSIGTVVVSTPATIFNGKTTVTTAGTRVALASTQNVQSVTVKALSTNTGLIFVGNATVASTNGFVLSAGDTVSLDIANLATVNLDCSVNGEGVTYVGVN